MAIDPNTERRLDESASKEVLLEELRDGLHQWNDLMDDDYREAQDDIAFLHGDQWDEQIRLQRIEEHRPVLTFPKLAQFVDMVVGDEMQQKPAIKIRPADGVSTSLQMSTQAKRSIKMSDGLNGIIRSIERNSHARLAYDNGFEGAVGWGFGHWRVLRKYADDSFDQELMVVPIFDPFAVAWDPNAQEYTKEDASWGLIRTSVPKKDFEKKHPTAAASNISFDDISHSTDWVRGDQIYLGEYFRKEEIRYDLILLSDGRILRSDQHGSILDELAATGIQVVKTRPHIGHRIDWYLVSGADVLEGPIEWPGRYIPIVSCWGRMLYKDGRIRYRGLFRNAKDEQRAYNYARTALIEKVALAPKTPWVVADEQIKGYETLWGEANLKNHAYLPYKAVRTHSGSPLPPPTREFGSTDVSGIAEMILSSEQGMKSSIGIYDPSLGQRSNEKSGKAIIARQQQGDKMTWPFFQNLARSIEYTGMILVDLIPRTMDGERIAHILMEDDTEETLVLNQTVMDQQTGQPVLVNDVTLGRFNVVVDMGPSFLTRRLEASNAMMEFIEAIPSAGPLTADLIARNTDWPGADLFADRLKKGLVPPAVLEPSPEEMNQLPPEAKVVIDQAQQQVQAMQQQLQELAQQMQEMTAKYQSTQSELQQAEIDQRFYQRDAALQTKQLKINYDERVLKLERQVDDLRGKIADAIRKAAETRDDGK